MQLTLIMPCYNRAYDLQRVLLAYDRQETDAPFEIIAVDDASTDDTYAVLQNFQPENFCLRIERMDKNGGPGRARNQAIPLVEAPLMMFVGDDMLPQPGFVQGHINAHRENPQRNLAFLGKVSWPPDMPRNTLMSHIDGAGAQQFSYYYMRPSQEYDFRHFYTCNISLKTAFFKTLRRWFEPDFYYAGYEDAEVGYRLAKRGMKIIFREEMLTHHYHYYNIWGFAKRQRNTGVMLNILIRKQPQLLLNRVFAAQFYRILKLLTNYSSLSSPLSVEAVREFEEEACRLASFYEWYEDPAAIDPLYLALLDYFYYAGVIEGMRLSSQWKERLHSALARRHLLPALRSFVGGAIRSSTPLPPGYDRLFLDHLP
jgi:glycosyltransferase involved in cell wall biosynthesis